MDFSFPAHSTTGVLNGDDLTFFYYDIGLDNLQSWPDAYDWDSVVSEFKGRLDIEACTSDQMPKDFVPNTIRFTVPDNKSPGNESKAAAFFRHLRNVFAHYRVAREGDNYVLYDDNGHAPTMRGFVNTELLKRFCFSFFDLRDKIINDLEISNNPNIENQ